MSTWASLSAAWSALATPWSDVSAGLQGATITTVLGYGGGEYLIGDTAEIAVNVESATLMYPASPAGATMDTYLYFESDGVAGGDYWLGATAASTWTVGAGVPTITNNRVLNGATLEALTELGAASPYVPANVALTGQTIDMNVVAGEMFVSAGLARGSNYANTARLMYPIEVFYDNITTPIASSFFTSAPSGTAEAWFWVYSNTPVRLDFTQYGFSTPYAVDIYDVADPTMVIGSGVTTYDLPAYKPVTVTFYGSFTPGSTTYVVTATPITYDGVITAADMVRTPGVLRVSGSNFPANSTVNLAIVGSSFTTSVSTDATGIIAPRDVYVSGLNAGTYTLTAVSGPFHAQDTFVVQNDPLPVSSGPSDSTPTIPVGSGVVKWMLRDPYVGGLADLTFPINPTEMSSPFGGGDYTISRTVAETGQLHAWETSLRAHEWSFTGYLETQAFHDALEAYKNAGRRFHLRDHRNRIWTVTFTDFSTVPIRNVGKPWAMRYTVTAWIYGTWVDAT